jgi:hypothetical protein
MVLTILPGTRIQFDPDRIEKLEICCADTARVEVRIYSTDSAAPRLFEFPDKAAAVDFYRKVWLLRSGEALDDAQIESLMADGGIRPASGR